MEWVETTGRTVDEAKEAALDELGVDAVDAEFEVLAEARTGLFGRVRSEARVRARVKPTTPRSKDDRRDRRRRSGSSQGTSDGSVAGGATTATGPSSSASGSSSNRGDAAGRQLAGVATGGSSAATDPAGDRTASAATPGRDSGPGGQAGSAAVAGSAPGPAQDGQETLTAGRASGAAGAEISPLPQGASGASAEAPALTQTPGQASGGPGSPRTSSSSRRAGNGRKRDRAGSRSSGADSRDDDQEDGPDGMEEREEPRVEVALEEQGRIAEEFLTQLTTEFGVKASVSVSKPDEDTIELQLTGSDLGLLIGPKGATLLAIQNLTRTVVHHETGASNGRINVDVGGYRLKRTEALARFAKQVATSVQQNGVRTALEPMSSVDRKVVHDAISGIDGVSTVSEGEEPHRRVIVVPNAAP
jgi:spoIIIJ-associated protein